MRTGGIGYACARCDVTAGWLVALAGGALIGAAASLLLLVARETAGVSGILDGLIRPVPAGRPWRAAFAGGLVAGGVLLAAAAPGAFGLPPRSLGALALAGLLVGFGTRMGGGCTSGHGVCGLARLSSSSALATGVFMAAGVAAVLGLRVLGAAP